MIFHPSLIRFRTLPAVSTATLGLDEAVTTAATGDLWLFRGRSLADRAIRTATNSPVNHVGMAVALDSHPPAIVRIARLQKA